MAEDIDLSPAMHGKISDTTLFFSREVQASLEEANDFLAQDIGPVNLDEMPRGFQVGVVPFNQVGQSEGTPAIGK
jgi:hypothetical protein